MKTPFFKKRLKQFLCLAVIFLFFINTLGPIPSAQAQEFYLPVPGVMVHLSPPLDPPMLKGIKVHPDNPFRFDFILDQGDGSKELKNEATRLIKYFLASLTVPEKDLWVNLSPYEKDRIIPRSFGLTEMGRDLLAEDYMLKQITASLIYPEDQIGKKFWKRVYEEASRKYGTTNIPVNTFNKVWIVPEKAVVYENAKAGTAYIVESKLKVMLEQDYLSLQKHAYIGGAEGVSSSDLGCQIIREIVIPELTREANEDKNFVKLRQVYNSLILAAWYKKKIKDSILRQVYADKNKISGVGYKNSLGDESDIEAIYQRYLQAFKKGVYNYIKEEEDPITQQMVPRKYFSGGFDLEINVNKAMSVVDVSNKPSLITKLAGSILGGLLILGVTMTNTASVQAKNTPSNPLIVNTNSSTSVNSLINQFFNLDPDISDQARDQLREMGPQILGPLIERSEHGGFEEFEKIHQQRVQIAHEKISERVNLDPDLKALWGQRSTYQTFYDYYLNLVKQKDPLSISLVRIITQEQEKLPRDWNAIEHLIKDAGKEETLKSFEQLLQSPDVPDEYKYYMKDYLKRDRDMNHLLWVLATLGMVSVSTYAGKRVFAWRYYLPVIGTRLQKRFLDRIAVKIQNKEDVYRDILFLERNAKVQTYGAKLMDLLAGINDPSKYVEQGMIDIFKSLRLSKGVFAPETLLKIVKNQKLSLLLRSSALNRLLAEYPDQANEILTHDYLWVWLSPAGVNLLGGIQSKVRRAKYLLGSIATNEDMHDRMVRVAAIEAWDADGKTKENLLSRIVSRELWSSPEYTAAISALMDLNNIEAVYALKSEAKRGSEKAISALGHMSIPQAQAAIAELLAFQTWTLNDHVSISSFNHEFRDPKTRIALLEVWVASKEDKYNVLRTILRTLRENDENIPGILEHIWKMEIDTDEAADLLISYITDKHAAAALAWMKVPRAQELIEQMVLNKQEQAYHRVAALRIWNGSNEKKLEVLTVLVDEVGLGSSLEDEAIGLIRDLNSEGAVLLLKKMVKEQREKPIQALGRMKNPRAQKALGELALAKDGTLSVKLRLKAIKAWKGNSKAKVAVIESFINKHIMISELKEAFGDLANMEELEAVQVLAKMARANNQMGAMALDALNTMRIVYAQMTIGEMAVNDGPDISVERRLKFIEYWREGGDEKRLALLRGIYAKHHEAAVVSEIARLLAFLHTDDSVRMLFEMYEEQHEAVIKTHILEAMDALWANGQRQRIISNEQVWEHFPVLYGFFEAIQKSDYGPAQLLAGLDVGGIPSVTGNIQNWKGGEDNLKVLLELVSLPYRNRWNMKGFGDPQQISGVAREILASGTVNYINSLSHLLSAYDLQSDSNVQFRGFVADSSIDLKIRMTILDNYLEVVALEEVVGLQQQASAEKMALDDQVRNTRELFNQLMEEIKTPGIKISQQRRALEKAKKAMAVLRGAFLHFILQKGSFRAGNCSPE